MITFDEHSPCTRCTKPIGVGGVIRAVGPTTYNHATGEVTPPKLITLCVACQAAGEGKA